jgi:4a-hydroxytetrahydrobiopterin dehydratase
MTFYLVRRPLPLMPLTTMRHSSLSFLHLLHAKRTSVLYYRSAQMHQEALAGLEHWSPKPSEEDAKSLARTFRFKYFKHAWGFMSRVADECQRQKHHPEWSNTYNVVFCRWTTHKTGGLTGKDLIMARFCDEVAREIGEIGEISEAGQTIINQITEPNEGGTLQELADSSAVEGCKACAKGSA